MGELGKSCLKLESGFSLVGYVIFAFVLSLIVRLVLSLFRAGEISHKTAMPFWDAFCYSFRGFFPKPIKDGRNDQHSDYLGPFFLGWIELLTYPIFIILNAWSVIGAWLAFKTVAQWSGWKKNRSPFNRYLIGNALIVIFSALFLVGAFYPDTVEIHHINNDNYVTKQSVASIYCE